LKKRETFFERKIINFLFKSLLVEADEGKEIQQLRRVLIGFG
jgi:hypothetical protein